MVGKGPGHEGVSTAACRAWGRPARAVAGRLASAPKCTRAPWLHTHPHAGFIHSPEGVGSAVHVGHSKLAVADEGLAGGEAGVGAARGVAGGAL